MLILRAFLLGLSYLFGALMQETAGSLVVQPNGPLMESDNLIAFPIRITATKESKKIDMNNIDLFEVKDGQIKDVWLFSDNKQKKIISEEHK